MKLRERTCKDCGRIWSDEVVKAETSHLIAGLGSEKIPPCPKCSSKNVNSSPVKYVDEEEPKDWVFTFGIGQEHAGKYTVIFGTFNGAREEMIRRHDLVWAFQYPSLEAAGVEKWNLKCLK
jgi:NAD-dependent SIR2 family protein deacetylase